MSKVVICGAGLSGLISAYVLGRLSGHDIRLIGTVDLRCPPLGPWFLWATPESGKLLGLLGMNPRIETARIGYWDGGPFVLDKAPTGFVNGYMKATHHKGHEPPMSEGRTSFRCYNVEWADLMKGLLAGVELLKDLELLVHIEEQVHLISRDEDGEVTMVNNLSIGPEDWVVMAMPVPVIESIMGLEKRTEYMAVGYRFLKEVPFSWPTGTQYVYCISGDWPWYRVTNDHGMLLGETMDPSTLNQCDVIAPTQTPGIYRALPTTNTFQVGRAARADRSKLSDSAAQAFTAARMIEGKANYDDRRSLW